MNRNRSILARIFDVMRTAMIGAMFVGPVSAATFVVDSFDDAVDADPGDGVCATATGVCTLRAAVNESNIGHRRDTVRLPAGTYTLTIPRGEINASHAGSLNIDDRLVIRGEGQDVTTIDANGIDQAFQVGRTTFQGDPRTSLTLKHLTIKNGDAFSNLGGAIANFGRRLKLTNVTLRDNEAGLGGAINNEAGDVIIVRSRIVDNTGTSCCGGIRQIHSSARLKMSKSEVSGNVSGGVAGGMMCFGGEFKITKSSIAQNVSGAGGGGLVFEGSIAVIRHTVIAENGAWTGAGGVHIKAGDRILFIRSDIVNNEADLDGDGFHIGGGLISGGPTPPLLIAGTIQGNTDSGFAPDCAGLVLVKGGTVIGDRTGCTVHGP